MHDKLVLASDYRGIELREWLIDKATHAGLEVRDLGIRKGSPIDYIDISKLLAEEMRIHPEKIGVISCGSGQGVAIALNRFKHLRACVCRTAEEARQLREKLNANVLCLGSRYTENVDALHIMETFLSSQFTGAKHVECASKLNFNPTSHASDGVNLIVRALIIQDKYILMTTANDHPHFNSTYYFLPGGHVEYNEATFDALKREIFEEMGLVLEGAGFAGTLECSWLRSGKPYHEINIVYSANIRNLTIHKPPRSNDHYQKFVWVPLCNLENITLLPAELKKLIRCTLNKNEQSLFFSDMKA